MRVDKVVVVGPAEAGKSTLIERVGFRPLNLSHRGRTVAMDHATLRREGRMASLIGVPGQQRFAPVREVLSMGAAAAVWVHPEAADADGSTIELLGGPLRDLPYLVLVNRRAGGRRALGFLAPATLQPASEILVADLVEDTEAPRLIVASIWRLLE